MKIKRVYHCQIQRNKEQINLQLMQTGSRQHCKFKSQNPSLYVRKMKTGRGAMAPP